MCGLRFFSQDSDAVFWRRNPYCGFWAWTNPFLHHKRLLKTVLWSCVFYLMFLAPELKADGVTISGGNDFADIYGRLVGWIKGDLGRTLSISFVLIGLAYGMARQSLIGFATGVGAAVGLQVTPTIINSIFGL